MQAGPAHRVKQPSRLLSLALSITHVCARVRVLYNTAVHKGERALFNIDST